MKLTITLTIIVLVMVSLGVAVYYMQDKSTDNISELKATTSESVSYKSLEYNNKDLVDHTSYNSMDNICNGNNLNMNIKIEPCLVLDADSKNIEQYVNFSWTGNYQRNITWLFIYDGQLESGKVELWRNISRTRTDNYADYQQVNNYVVDGVQSYQDLGSPTELCHYGGIENNTRMFNVTRYDGGTLLKEQIYCFESVTPVNSSSFRISGYAYVQKSKQVEYYEYGYDDLTSQFEYLGVGLIGGNYSFYKVPEVGFIPGQSYYTKWTYTPKDKAKKGKWHILGYEKEYGLIESLTNERYIYVDPWWSNDWPYKKLINFTGPAYSPNSSIHMSIPIVANKMNESGRDLRFLDYAESTEYYHWVKGSNSTHIDVFVRIPDNSSIYMYYGNHTAASTSNMNQIVLNETHGRTFTGGSATGINFTHGVRITTNHTLELVNVYRTTGATGISSRVVDNGITAILDDQFINENNVANHSYILANATSYRMIITSANQTPTRRYVGSAAYPHQMYNFRYTTGITLSSADDPTDLYNYQSIATAKVSLINYSFGAEESSGGGSTDNDYPIFSGYLAYPANNTQYYPSAIYLFNTTITSTNGTAGIEFNEVNYSMTNTSNFFTAQVGSFGAGTYAYHYWAYGNGTDAHYNSTIVKHYTIAINNSWSGVSLTATSPITYGTTTDFTGSGCLSGMVCALNITNAVYARGTVWANYSSEGNQNYTASSALASVLINQGIPALTLSATTPITYGATTDFTGGGCPAELTCSLNVTNAVYSAGSISGNYSTPGNENYTAGSAVASVTINKATGLVYTYVNGSRASLSGNISQAFLINVSLITGQFGTLALSVGGVTVNTSTSNNITNLYNFTSAGSYTILGTYSGNTNYTSDTESWTVTIYSGTSTSASNTSNIYELPSINDSEGLLSMFLYVNTVSDNIFFPIILFVIFIIVFISLMAVTSASSSWTFACFLTGVLSMPLAILGLLAPRYMYLILFCLAGGVVWLVLESRR